MSASTDARRLSPRVWLALALLFAYVLPVYWPPAAVPLEAPSAAASLMERLFPGVPAVWVTTRLAALLIGAGLLAEPLTAMTPWPAPSARVACTESPGRRTVVAALLFALAHVGAGLAAPGFGARAQLTYLLAGLVPAGILWLGVRRAAQAKLAPAHATRARRVSLAAFTSFAAFALLALAWLALRVAPALHSPRTASATDMWLNFGWLLEAAASARNLLASRSEVSATDAWMLFAGVNLLRSGELAALPVVLTIGALWLGIGAVLLAVLTAMAFDRWAALVAVAAFLFSPLCLFLVLSVAPFGIPIAVGAAMLVALWLFYVTRSRVTLVAFAAFAGMGATQLHLLHVSLLGVAFALVYALRRPRVEPMILAAAVCVFAAPTVPSVGQIPSLTEVREAYVDRSWQWAGLEGVLYEQRGVRRRPTPEQLMHAGAHAPLDIQIGAVLMPFAVARTSLRLTGDVLFEPISAALAAVGICVAALHAARDPRCAGALALIAVALLPALAGSQYDRVSLTRAILLPLSVGIFAALGFSRLGALLLPARAHAPAAVILAALIAVSGSVVFDVVNPRILATSAMELVLEAAGNGAGATDGADNRADDDDGDRRGIAVIAGAGKRDLDWLHVERIARYAARPPLDVVGFARGDGLSQPPAGGARVLMWSPGIEEDAGVSRALCGSMPDAAIYELRSLSGLSRVYAAARAGDDWRPPLAADRWNALDCESECFRARRR